MNRLGATVWSVVVCGAVLSPIVQGFRDTPRDDFPLSWFPMFAAARPAIEKPVYAVAIGGGEHAFVPSHYWTAGGFNQGAFQLLDAASVGPTKLRPLCERIARAVAKRPPRGVSSPGEVEIRRGAYSLETFFGAGDSTPISETVLVSCPVPVE
jgi:hypothetical protein